MKTNTLCFFVSDLHGSIPRYTALFQTIVEERPAAVFLGGDLFPSFLRALTAEGAGCEDFINDVMAAGFEKVRAALGEAYPRVFLILGNDDLRSEETDLLAIAGCGLWDYVHGRHVAFDRFSVYGYACVPPTPFRLKDWERYDVSRYVEPGCLHPSEGAHSVPVSESDLKYGTIQDDLKKLLTGPDLANAILLFHAPPYNTNLDRCALDGKMIDYVPLDVHVGSIAIRRFIETRQPLLTLHGHIHESTRLTGSWNETLGATHCFSAAHDGSELALIRFDPNNLSTATRELIKDNGKWNITFQ